MRKPYGHSERLADARPCVGRPFTAGGPMRWTTGMALVLTVVAGLLGSCATAPASREDKAALVAAATARLQQMQTEDPALGALLQKGYGYALFRRRSGHVSAGAYDPALARAMLRDSLPFWLAGLFSLAYSRGDVGDLRRNVDLVDGRTVRDLVAVGADRGGVAVVLRQEHGGDVGVAAAVALPGGRLGRGPDEWSRYQGQLRRRCGGGDASPQWGDGGSRHWRAAVHLSGQVSPLALCHTLSVLWQSAARARGVLKGYAWDTCVCHFGQTHVSHA